jgi:hypothetical protein
MKACLAVRRFVRLVRHPGARTALLVCGLAAACGEPSRLPDVLPLTPTSDVFPLSGTVTETAPTTSIRIPHAVLALDGVNSGASTMADETGRFSFGDVKGGRFNLVASREGYETRSYAIELKRPSDFMIRISPSLEMVSETHTATIDWSVPPCRRDYCFHGYNVIAHHDGDLSMQLDWTGDAELMLSTDNWEVWFSSTSKTIARTVRIGGGNDHTVYVNYTDGTGPAKYTLVMTHPN